MRKEAAEKMRSETMTLLKEENAEGEGSSRRRPPRGSPLGEEAAPWSAS